MATIERIEQDIQAIEKMSSEIADSFQESYTAYFAALGQAVKQQLILATYHLCTQGYPQTFLRLSLNNRQKMQQSIRNLGMQTAEQLLNYMKPETEPVSNQGEMLVHQSTTQEVSVSDITNEKEDQQDQSESQEAISLSFIELLASQASSLEIKEIEELQELREIEELDEFQDEDTSDIEKNEESEPEKKPDPKKTNPQLPRIPIFPQFNPVPLRFSAINTSNPIETSKWVQSLEISTQFALKKLSREANLLLQKADILPKKLPEAIIEAATAASEATDVIPGPPNVINVVVEVENERQSNDSNLTQIMAINLRLSEIEFADSQVSFSRKQIRILQGQLQKLRREYIKKQRELAVAQAEAAWRASWFDETEHS
ncbi:MAG: hypothetical protein IGS39_12770 [Calothrix sp. C42_A2020_038]|nr:hypothetical protein [Calothrix sp. C42_A2020_038]